VNNVTSHLTSFEITIPSLTSDQCNRLLDLLWPSNTNSTNFTSNLASCYIASFPNHEWIIDSGTSDHITLNLSSFYNVQPLHQPCPIKFPNNDIVYITHTDILHVSPNISFSNVYMCIHLNLIYCPLANSPLLSIVLPYFFQPFVFFRTY